MNIFLSLNIYSQLYNMFNNNYEIIEQTENNHDIIFVIIILVILGLLTYAIKSDSNNYRGGVGGY